jgi:Fe-Mn family superoxide dismutase
MNRRQSLKIMLGAAGALAAPAVIGRAPLFAQAAKAAPAFTLPPLGYAYEALEPHIDTATMGFHHKNHHNAFIGVLNAQVEKWPDLTKKPIVEIISNLSSVPDAVRTPVRNAGGGHWNHTFFWDLMTPGGPKAPTTEVAAAINSAFGSFEKMTEAVNQAGMTRFGSGWAWLVVGKDKKLAAVNTPYQDTPHMDLGVKPILGVDVWEHAYYLKHQYRRADYLKAWWNTVNWNKVAANFKSAM